MGDNKGAFRFFNQETGGSRCKNIDKRRVHKSAPDILVLNFETLAPDFPYAL